MKEHTVQDGLSPDIATSLAFERTRVAYERTMMAWVRTGTSLITFGFSVHKFFQIELNNPAVQSTLIGPRGFGIALIAIGLLSLLFGTVEHARDLRALKARYPVMPQSTSHLIGMVVGILGLLALVVVIVRA